MNRSTRLAELSALLRDNTFRLINGYKILQKLRRIIKEARRKVRPSIYPVVATGKKEPQRKVSSSPFSRNRSFSGPLESIIRRTILKKTRHSKKEMIYASFLQHSASFSPRRQSERGDPTHRGPWKELLKSTIRRASQRTHPLGM